MVKKQITNPITIGKKVETIVHFQLLVSFEYGIDKGQEPHRPEMMYHCIQWKNIIIGRMIGIDYAEGFTCERFVATDYLSNLI